VFILDQGQGSAIKIKNRSSATAFRGEMDEYKEYKSPEQLGLAGTDNTGDTSSDMYSLGVILFKLFFGLKIELKFSTKNVYDDNREVNFKDITPPPEGSRQNRVLESIKIIIN